MQINRYEDEDETDLRELYRTIIDRKKFIFLFTTIVTLISLGYVFLKTPIYEATALIEIGSYKMYNNDKKNNNNNDNNNNERVILDNNTQLARRLNILYIDMLKNKKDRVSKIETIKIPKNTKNFIEIKSLSTSNKLAIKEISNVVLFVQKKHQKILDDIKQEREAEIKNIDIKIDNIKKRTIPLLAKKIKLQEQTILDFKTQVENISKNLKKIENTNPSLSALKLMEKRDLTSFIIKLNTQLMDMRDKKSELSTTAINSLKKEKAIVSSLLLSHNYKNTQIVGEIMTNDFPVKPKKKLMVVVSFVTAFILSIFIVFFLNFIRDEKQKRV